LARDSIRFLLIPIVSGTDCQLSLKTDNLTLWRQPLGLNQLCQTPVPQRSLQLENGMKSPVE
jgi:hypothetical protein